MKQAIEDLSRKIQERFPGATIEHITMFADSLVRYKEIRSKQTRGKPYKAKDIIAILIQIR